jgi:hypothetical protein
MIHEASKSGIVEIQDWLIKLGSRAENPKQDFLMLFVGDCLRKQGNQGSGIVVARGVYVSCCTFFTLLVQYTGWPGSTALYIYISHNADAGPPIHCCVTVTLFVCVNCIATGHLSSRWLFLNRAGKRRHIRASKACFAADLGFKEIHVDARAGDVMAGAGALLVLRLTNIQVKQYTYTVTIVSITTMLVAQWLTQLAGMHKVVGSNLNKSKFLLLNFMFIET